jgi:hypothetical protein
MKFQAKRHPFFCITHYWLGIAAGTTNHAGKHAHQRIAAVQDRDPARASFIHQSQVTHVCATVIVMDYPQ